MQSLSNEQLYEKFQQIELGFQICWYFFLCGSLLTLLKLK